MRIPNKIAMLAQDNMVIARLAGDMTVTNVPATTAPANLANLTYDIKTIILEELVDKRTWKDRTTWHADLREVFGKRGSISRVCKAWYIVVLDFFCRVVSHNRLLTGWMARHLELSALHYHTLTYVMTRSSLDRVSAVANNPRLAKFITQVKYASFDFEKHRSQARIFKEELSFTDEDKLYFRRKTPAGQAKLLDVEYRQYMGYYSEHQQLIKKGRDVAVLKGALARFENLRGICFQRFSSDWLSCDHRIFRFGKPKILSKSVMKARGSDLSLKPLHAPIYWNGFLNLASIASTYPKIDTLILDRIVPDISLIPEPQRRPFAKFFEQVEHLSITVIPDIIEPRGSRPRCRRTGTPSQDIFDDYGKVTKTLVGYDPEPLVWNRVLAGAKRLETLEIETCQWDVPFIDAQTQKERSGRDTRFLMVSKLAQYVLNGSSATEKLSALRKLVIRNIEIDMPAVLDLLKRAATKPELLCLHECSPKELMWSMDHFLREHEQWLPLKPYVENLVVRTICDNHYDDPGTFVAEGISPLERFEYPKESENFERGLTIEGVEEEVEGPKLNVEMFVDTAFGSTSYGRCGSVLPGPNIF